MKQWRVSRFIIIYTAILVTLAVTGYYVEVYQPRAAIQHRLHENQFFASDLTFYDLPRISMKMGNGIKAGNLRLDISLEVTKKDMYRINDFQSRITDRIINYLYKQNLDEMRPPKDIAWLHRDLLKLINDTNQPVPVHDIVFREMVIM
jgi:flagellar basal body-associated protein FliL